MFFWKRGPWVRQQPLLFDVVTPQSAARDLSSDVICFVSLSVSLSLSLSLSVGMVCVCWAGVERGDAKPRHLYETAMS